MNLERARPESRAAAALSFAYLFIFFIITVLFLVCLFLSPSFRGILCCFDFGVDLSQAPTAALYCKTSCLIRVAVLPE